MSTQDPTSDFIAHFTESISKLSGFKQSIDSRLTTNRQFSSYLTKTLTEIKDKLNDLAGKIQALKQRCEDMNGNVNSNEDAIQEYQRGINDLTTQRTEREAQLNEQINRLKTDAIEKQKRIDECEAQLRSIISRPVSEQGESGEQAQTQATALNDIIEEKDREIKQIQQQIQEATADHSRIQEELQTQVNSLTNHITQLTAKNEELKQQIMTATDTLNGIANELEKFYNEVPNTQTQNEVNALLNEINTYLDDISRNVQDPNPNQSSAKDQEPNPNPNQSSAKDQVEDQDQVATSSPNNSGKLDDNTLIPVSITESPTESSVKEMRLGDIKNRLRIKVQQINKTSIPYELNKYNTALIKINKATNIAAVQEALRNIRLKINSKTNTLNVLGGQRTKQTKKNKKQKGGFIYKKTIRRRIIPSTIRSRKPSKSRKSSIKSSVQTRKHSS